MPGNTVRTGRNGRVLLVRGEESILIAPNSVVGLPSEKKEGLATTIKQQAGSILLEVEKKSVKHFEVETPYLAAVVKGTQFRVTVSASGVKVDVSVARSRLPTSRPARLPRCCRPARRHLFQRQCRPFARRNGHLATDPTWTTAGFLDRSHSGAAQRPYRARQARPGIIAATPSLQRNKARRNPDFILIGRGSVERPPCHTASRAVAALWPAIAAPRIAKTPLSGLRRALDRPAPVRSTSVAEAALAAMAIVRAGMAATAGPRVQVAPAAPRQSPVLLEALVVWLEVLGAQLVASLAELVASLVG